MTTDFITLKLDVFEGPLDLLLYLIKKNNLEISRISISKIAAQYLEYLDTMKDLNIDLASEFLFMAAELAHLKSRAVLPRQNEGESDEADEAADALLAKLRQYQKYKELAAKLSKRTLLGRDTFQRASIDFGGEEISVTQNEPKQQSDEWDVSAYELVRAFHDILKKLPQERREHRVIAERVSVTERIYEILDQLRRVESVLFHEMFAGHTEKIDFVVTFLAILEMGKLHMVQVTQTQNYGAIRVRQRIAETDDENVVTEVNAESVTYK